MLMEEFEDEISYLLRRMKGIIDYKSQDGASRKMKLSASKSSMELKKLEWTISYKKKIKKTRVVTNVDISRGASRLGCK